MLEAGHTGYVNPASGLLLAKKAVCTKLAKDNALTYRPEQVIITSGGKMACYLAIHAVVNPGDEVIIPKPYWVSYPEIVKLAGGTPVYVTGPEENDFKVSPELLARVVTNRATRCKRCRVENQAIRPNTEQLHDGRELASDGP